MLIVACGGASPAPAAPIVSQRRPIVAHSDPRLSMPPASPIARADRSTPVTEPELARAAALYATLTRAQFGLTQPLATTQDEIRALVAQFSTNSQMAQQVAEACTIESGWSVPVRVAAVVLVADACDFLAGHAASMTVPLPSPPMT